MLEVKKWKLGTKKAVTKHEEIVSHMNAYSLTMTLNPFYNSYSIDDQYNHMSKQIINLFKELGPYYEELMMTPEYTVNYNLHWHIYFVTKHEYMVFEQNMKHHKLKYKMIGFNYRLKKIDDVTNNLKSYPFKDLERTIYFSEILSQRFNPQHIYIRPTGNIIINVNNDTKVIDNDKTYKVMCLKERLLMMKKQIDLMEKII